MSINPRDYDLDELRKMARERGGETGRSEQDDSDIDIGTVGRGEADVSKPTSNFRATLYRELLPLEAGADADKPYLERLPEHYAGEHLIFEWIEFLLLHAGYQGAMEALDYYAAVGWITDECKSDLNDYMLGLDEQSPNDPTDLDVDDHLLSLVYIGKLASMQ